MVEVETLKKEIIKFLPVNGISSLYPVKPFVVTQNIEVGDEIFDITDKGAREGLRFIVEKDEGDCWLTTKKTNNHCVTKESAYKIIGEVSPEATFVEDGKEYEIERCVTVEQSPDYTQKRYYKVLCPTCKNYH